MDHNVDIDVDGITGRRQGVKNDTWRPRVCTTTGLCCFDTRADLVAFAGFCQVVFPGLKIKG